MDSKHVVNYPSPSALAGCAACRDRWRMEQAYGGGFGENTNEDARIGTAIHEACRLMLEDLWVNKDAYRDTNDVDNKMHARLFLEMQAIKGWDEKYWELALNNVLTVYAELCSMEIKYGDVTVMFEQVCDLSNYLDDYFGTADVVAIAENELMIADYKTGWRTVSAIENRQLVCYAAAWLDAYEIEDVTLYIVQSTKNHYQKWQATADNIRKIMDDNISIIREVSDGKMHYKNPCETACTYCKAKQNCADYLDDLISPASEVVEKLGRGGELSNVDRAKLYIATNRLETFKRQYKDALFAAVEAGEVEGFCIKRNSDRLTVDEAKKNRLLSDMADRMPELEQAGVVHNETVIDAKKLVEVLGPDAVKYLKVTPGAAKLIKAG